MPAHPTHSTPTRSSINVIKHLLTALSIGLGLFTTSGGLEGKVCNSCPFVNVVDSKIEPFDATGTARYAGTNTSCEDYVNSQVLFPSVDGSFDRINVFFSLAFLAFSFLSILAEGEVRSRGLLGAAP